MQMIIKWFTSTAVINMCETFKFLDHKCMECYILWNISKCWMFSNFKHKKKTQEFMCFYFSFGKKENKKFVNGTPTHLKTVKENPKNPSVVNF